MSSIEKTALGAPSIAVSAVGPAAVAVPIAIRTPRTGLRVWLLTVALLLVPIITYWPATFHDYGLRDDYSNLREAHEEPGTVVKFCASHARPIYGLLLQASYGHTGSVQDLQWMRLIAVLLLGTISLISFRSLRAFGWSFNASICFALLVGLVPSAQVIAGWAIGWPYAVAALLAIGGFFAAEGAIAAGIGTHRSLAQWGVALGLMVVSALIYQPSALFYVVPLAAALVAQRRRTLVQSALWGGVHLGFLAISLGTAYLIMTGLYADGVFAKSGRIAFEHQWLEKIAWFLREPLPNALSMFVLNDDNRRDHALYIACAGLVGLILTGGAIAEWRRHGRDRGLIWLAGLLILPVVAFSISMLASERYATYRTIFAMTAVLLIFLVASFETLTESLSAGVRRTLVGAVLVTAMLCAQHHTYALLAMPQGNEWELIVEGARQVHLPERHSDTRPRIFAIASAVADKSTATVYHDEFGSLSSNSEWVPKEMFKRAMHDLHPEMANVDSRYEFAEGTKLPVGQRYDVIIDLHRLRRFYSDN